MEEVEKKIREAVESSMRPEWFQAPDGSEYEEDVLDSDELVRKLLEIWPK